MVINKKSLIGIIFAGTAIATNVGCSSKTIQYQGSIDNEYVSYEQRKNLLRDDENILNVVRPKGEEIKYRDSNGDFKIDSVEITDINGENILISQSYKELNFPFLEYAQNHYEEYLDKIEDINY